MRIIVTLHPYLIMASCGQEPSQLFMVAYQACLTVDALQQLQYVVVLDMAAVIHIIKLHRASVFGVFTQMHLLPYLTRQMSDSTTRVDAIWDRYIPASLKSQTRVKRGETTES